MTGSSPDDTTPVAETPETTAPATPVSDVTAAPSPAETKPAETILDRVKSTLAETRKDTSPVSQTPVKQPAETEPTTASNPDELSADEVKTTNPKTQERFRKLTSDLRTTRSELETLKPKAAEFDQIDKFIRQAGLAPNDVGSILTMAALSRSDPAKALEKLVPFVENLRRQIGEVLPDPLQQRVDQGYLTQEDALALNRASSAAARAEQRAQALEDQRQQHEQGRQQDTAVNATLDAVDVWEKAQAKSDPDWSQKQAEVSELVELAITRKSNELKTNWWPTPAEALQLSKDAAAKVGERFKRFTPRPRAIEPPVTAGASPRSTSAPKNTLDIIKRHVNGRFSAG